MLAFETIFMLALGIAGFLMVLLIFLVVFGILAAMICKKIIHDPDDEN